MRHHWAINRNELVIHSAPPPKYYGSEKSLIEESASVMLITISLKQKNLTRVEKRIVVVTAATAINQKGYAGTF